MSLEHHPGVEISEDLLEAIRSLPLERQVEHCGSRITVSPFDLYADCPQCGARIKVRSFSGGGEIEDVFDAVFEWINQPKAREMAQRRQMVLDEDR
jgi:hypothetical protein